MSKILLDVSRYIPALTDCNYKKSMWEVKAVLSSNEFDDSRPIPFLPNHGINGYHCVLGGKIDNVYDVVDIIKKLGHGYMSVEKLMLLFLWLFI